jgi:hypothetical protein
VTTWTLLLSTWTTTIQITFISFFSLPYIHAIPLYSNSPILKRPLCLIPLMILKLLLCLVMFFYYLICLLTWLKWFWTWWVIVCVTTFRENVSCIVHWWISILIVTVEVLFL